jgi:trk system potassium uptake protein TrkA
MTARRIGIVGAGRFGTALAESLSERGAEVLLLDRVHETVQRMSTVVTVAVQGDAADERTLSKAGFGECDTVIVAIGSNLQGSILATAALKDIKVPHVVAKASSDMHGKVLKRIGADLVVYPNREPAQRLARALLAKSALDYFQVAEGMSVLEAKAPEKFVGRTLLESGIRRKHGITILAIKRASPEGQLVTIASPSADEVIEPDDILLMFGSDKHLEKIS